MCTCLQGEPFRPVSMDVALRVMTSAMPKRFYRVQLNRFGVMVQKLHDPEQPIVDVMVDKIRDAAYEEWLKKELQPDKSSNVLVFPRVAQVHRSIIASLTKVIGDPTPVQQVMETLMIPLPKPVFTIEVDPSLLKHLHPESIAHDAANPVSDAQQNHNPPGG